MARPVVVDTAVTIRRPPEAVWPYLVDWERLGRWMLELQNVRVTSERREGVGTEAVGTVRIAGISTTDRVRVTAWEPPHMVEIAHLGWVKGSGLMVLRPHPEGSRLLWRETLRPPWGPVGAAGLRLLRPVLRRIFARDARVLKALAEREAA